MTTTTSAAPATSEQASGTESDLRALNRTVFVTIV